MEEVVPGRTSANLHPPSPPTVLSSNIHGKEFKTSSNSRYDFFSLSMIATLSLHLLLMPCPVFQMLYVTLLEWEVIQDKHNFIGHQG